MPVKLVEVELVMISEGFLGVGFNVLLVSNLEQLCQGDWWKIIDFPFKFSCSPLFYFTAEMCLGRIRIT